MATPFKTLETPTVSSEGTRVPIATGKVTPAAFRNARVVVSKKPKEDLEIGTPAGAPAAVQNLKTPLLGKANGNAEQMPEIKRGLCSRCCGCLSRCFLSLCRLLRNTVLIVIIAACACGPFFLAPLVEKAMATPLEAISDVVAQLDYSLKATGDPSQCIAADGSWVGFEDCATASTKTRGFDLAADGTIRLHSQPSHCLTVVSSGNIELAKCSANSQQVWIFHEAGTFELQSKRSWCLAADRGDVQSGRLGLRQCSLTFGDLFEYGGGHFMVPSLMTKIDSFASSLRQAIATFLPPLALLLIIFILLCRGLMKAARSATTKCHRRSMKMLVACIFLILGAQYLALVYVAFVHHGVGEFAIVGTTAHLDYSLRMSAFPDYCVTSEESSPFLVSMEKCKSGSQAQQFVMESSDGQATLHLKAKPNRCISSENGQVTLDDCDKAATFADPQATGGSLPLANTDTCLNLLGGDIDSGTLGFYACSADPNQVFVYSQGNPTVAQLLREMSSLSKSANASSGIAKKIFGLISKFGRYAIIGVAYLFLFFGLVYFNEGRKEAGK